MTGLELVDTLLAAGAVLMGLSGAVLILLDRGAGAEAGGGGRRLAGLGWFWRGLAETPWRRLPGCACAACSAGYQRLVRAGFTDADRSAVAGFLFMALIFAVLPIAATLNAALGGSPILFKLYLAAAAALAVLYLSGEFPRLAALNGGLAVFLGLTLFLIIPGYVTYAFTDHLRNTVFSHGVLGSILVAPLVYLTAFGARLAMDGVPAFSSDRRRAAAHGFLAALPVAFVLFFFALLAGHFAVQEQSPGRPWPLLVWAVTLTAASAPMTSAVIGWGLKGRPVIVALALAAGLSAVLSLVLLLAAKGGTMSPPQALDVLAGLAAAGGGVYLGPDFWVMHLPMLPVLVLGAAILLAMLGKGVTAMLGGKAQARPFLAGGWLCLAVGALLAAGALGL